MQPLRAALLVVFLALAGTASAQDVRFQDRNGLVVIEAESAATDGRWAVRTDVEGYTGEGYVVADSAAGELAYPVEIRTPGRYLVLLRSAAPHPTEANDSWIRLDGPDSVSVKATAGDRLACSQHDDGWYKTFMNESGDRWSWNNKNGDHTEKRLFFHVEEPGPYTLRLGARSPGHKVDRLALKHDAVTDGQAQLLDHTETRFTSEAAITGTLRTWYPVTLTFDGPETSEDATPNPFSDYRLVVTFRWGAREIEVPGFFAADGDAAETSATSGNKWRVYFTPDAPGRWTYTASFRQGPDVAASLDPYAGTPTAFDGASGSFDVAPAIATGNDVRARGMLLPRSGERYLYYAGTGEPFVKGGAGSPENLLAYLDFDSTYARQESGQAREGEAATAPLHRYEPHVRDWNEGDPTWQDGKGKGLIGGLNYLAEEGMNTVYFLTMNWRGDGDDVWPWTAPETQDRFDVSKLAQWEIVFSHMDSLGLAMNMVLQETENDTLFDGGQLGRLRTLYYRELIARFGHHLGVTWNLGEETNHATSEVKAFTDYFKAVDPYGHPVIIHNHVHLIPETLDPLLGYEPFNGVSFQVANPKNVHDHVVQYLDASRAAGHPWIVNLDEIGFYAVGATPDGPESNRNTIRREVLWGALMAGSAGVSWYFGARYPHNDLNLEDWRSRDSLWADTRYALRFFRAYLPFAEMQHHDGLTWEADDYVLAQPGEVYALYLPNGGAPVLELKDYPDVRFSVQWYNPRRGTHLITGSLSEVTGGSPVIELGEPPGDADQDWAVLVRRLDR